MNEAEADNKNKKTAKQWGKSQAQKIETLWRRDKRNKNGYSEFKKDK